MKALPSHSGPCRCHSSRAQEASVSGASRHSWGCWSGPHPPTHTASTPPLASPLIPVTFSLHGSGKESFFPKGQKTLKNSCLQKTITVYWMHRYQTQHKINKIRWLCPRDSESRSSTWANGCINKSYWDLMESGAKGFLGCPGQASPSFPHLLPDYHKGALERITNNDKYSIKKSVSIKYHHTKAHNQQLPSPSGCLTQEAESLMGRTETQPLYYIYHPGS